MQEKMTISQWEKKVGKESKEVAECLEKVLSNLVCLCLESCLGERVQGSFVANTVHDHLLEYFFFPQKIGVISDIPP